MQNPLPEPASARVTFMTQDGPVANQTVMIPPNSRKSIHVNDIVPNALVATRVEAETSVFAERTVYIKLPHDPAERRARKKAEGRKPLVPRAT